MLQPLNQTPFFSGKTFNHHPARYNTPLRLNEQERINPLSVFQEFFQNYHLNDVREIMWSWTVAVVSSPNSISTDANDRNNHLFFYEKVEQLIEACWMLTPKDH